MAIVFTITDAGRAALIDADHDGTNAVVIAEVGLGSGRYAPTKDQTDLKAPIKRIDTIAGQAVADDTLHVTVQDETGDAYQVGEIGLFTDGGVLFAVYSQSDWIIEKAAPATLLLATDLVVESLDVSSITFGDAAFLNPPASETVQGVIELATQAEVDAGTDRRRAIVPRTLKAFVDKVLKAYATVKQLADHAASRDHPAATTSAQGMVELATYAETKTGEDNTRAVTPAGNKSALDAHRTETGAHAADRISLGNLSKLGNPKTVEAALAALGSAAVRDEGAGNGLDADKLDGQQGSYYRNAGHLNAGTLPKARLSGSYDIDIGGTAADANKLDGQQGSYYRNAGNLNAGTLPKARLSGSYDIDIGGTAADANKLGGQPAASYLRSNADDTFTGTLLGNALRLGGAVLQEGSSAKLQVKGFIRTGDIYLHEGGNPSSDDNNKKLGNNAGELEWDKKKVYHAGNLSPVESGKANQTVGDGFFVSGNKFYFGSAGKEHNLFDNDGAGHAGLQFGMDKDVSTGTGAAVEFQANIDNSDDGSWELSLDSHKRSKGDNISFDQVLKGSRSGLTWNGNKLWDAGNFDPSSKLGKNDKAADSNKLDGQELGVFYRSNTSNSSIRMGSGSDTNWDGIQYDEGDNTLSFYADQEPGKDTPRVRLGPGWVEAGGDRLLKAKDYDATQITNGDARLTLADNGNLDFHDGSKYRFRIRLDGRIDRADGGIDSRLLNISAGGVGTYAFLSSVGKDRSPGDTESGSNLRWANPTDDSGSGNPSGTWMCMGRTSGSRGDYRDRTTAVWARIS